jgi:hypothetical protein
MIAPCQPEVCDDPADYVRAAFEWLLRVGRCPSVGSAMTINICCLYYGYRTGPMGQVNEGSIYTA